MSIIFILVFKSYFSFVFIFSMFNKLLVQLNKLSPVNKEEETALLDFLIIKDIPKGDFLLSEGQMCNYVLFILTGSLRVFSKLADGSEDTMQFIFEGDFYTDFDSYLNDIQSEVNIQAIEDSKVYIMHRQGVENLGLKYDIFDLQRRVIAELSFKGLKTKLDYSNKNISAEDRYLKLLQEHPSIFEKVPLKYIASFLGITPQSLSRIRSILAKSNK